MLVADLDGGVLQREGEEKSNYKNKDHTGRVGYKLPAEAQGSEAPLVILETSLQCPPPGETHGGDDGNANDKVFHREGCSADSLPHAVASKARVSAK